MCLCFGSIFLARRAALPGRMPSSPGAVRRRALHRARWREPQHGHNELCIIFVIARLMVMLCVCCRDTHCVAPSARLPRVCKH